MNALSIVTGLGFQDLGLLLIRVTTGAFFLIYRFRWVFDPSAVDKCWLSPTRHIRLRNRLCSCGYTDHPSLAAAVAVIEILGGLGLIFGLLSVLSALGLFIVLVFANLCTPKEEIPLMKPVDKVDYVRCYLHLAEPLYLAMAFLIIVAGPGKYSLDYLLLSLWGLV